MTNPQLARDNTKKLFKLFGQQGAVTASDDVVERSYLRLQSFINNRGGLEGRSARRLHRRKVFEEILEIKDPCSADLVGDQDQSFASKAVRNPYKGLHYFSEHKEDAQDFFGRDELVDTLLEAFAMSVAATVPSPNSSRSANCTRLLGLIGPSASGKSSVARAGVLRTLMDGSVPNTREWRYLDPGNWVYLNPIVPGIHPIEALATTLAANLETDVASILKDLKEPEGRGLHLCSRKLLHHRNAVGSRVLLLVDQFEEIFTQVQDERERAEFVRLLHRAVTEPDGPFALLLTMRSDFLGRLASYPDFSLLLNDHLEQVPPLVKLDDLRAVIEIPASKAGLTLDEGLADRLLADVQGQPGAMPLLEFALEELVEQNRGRKLELATYEKLGGVKGTLSHHAEAIYQGLDSREQRFARILFRRLINPSVTVADTTRRRIGRSELWLPDASETQIIQQVARFFSDRRLLICDTIAGEDTLELSHEALIQQWPRLAEWVREAPEDIRIQQDVSHNAGEWKRLNRPRSDLYSGRRLNSALNWAKDGTNRASKDESDFLHAGYRSRLQKRAFLAIGTILVLLASQAFVVLLVEHSSDLHASVTNCNDSGAGSLRAAVESAQAGQVITFAPSLSCQAIKLTSGELDIATSMTIEGPSAGIKISGERRSRVFVIEPSTNVSLVNLDIVNGYSRTVALDQRPAQFDGNEGMHRLFDGVGGGIYNAGALQITNCTIEGNVAENDGGGIYNDGLSTSSSVISDGQLTLRYTAVIRNVSDVHVVAMEADSSDLNLQSNGGGGIYDDNGNAIITNSIISGNLAESANSNSNSNGGGGVFAWGGYMTIMDTAVTKNRNYSYGFLDGARRIEA